MAVNNLDLDVKFWYLRPGWRLYFTQPLSLEFYRKKYAKKPCTFSIFQKLLPFESAHVRAFAIFFRVHQNRTTGADFVILGLCEISDIPPQTGELYDNSSK